MDPTSGLKRDNLADMAKARIGRPPLGKETTLYNFKVDAAMLSRWQREADRQGVSLSEWLREAAEEKRARAEKARKR